MPDYSAERYNPTFARCGALSLLFDGSRLVMNGGRKVGTYRAVSGKPLEGGKFDYSVERQRTPNVGPIPTGVYWIRPDELDDNYVNTFIPGFSGSWGRYRISIHPFTSTQTYGRGGFFIHGGSVAGSAGCIDLTREMDRFVADLLAEGLEGRTCQLHLRVRYPAVGDYPITSGGGARVA